MNDFLFFIAMFNSLEQLYISGHTSYWSAQDSSIPILKGFYKLFINVLRDHQMFMLLDKENGISKKNYDC
jgi:hypothetical protein